MTPSEKAKELVEKFIGIESGWSDNVVTDDIQAKECALIAVRFAKENPLNTDGYNKYLDEVEQEINKL